MRCRMKNLNGVQCGGGCENFQVMIPLTTSGQAPADEMVKEVATALGARGWLCWWDEDSPWYDLGMLDVVNEEYVKNHHAGKPLHVNWNKED